MNDFFNDLIREFQLPLVNPILIFSLILFIILLAPILLKRIQIPGIVGLIISGVIIGPHGVNILEKNSAVELFSTIGLLYIMFMAGIELNMNEFKANRNKSIVFGFFTFALPLAIGYPVCRYVLNYDFDASLLTASMFATHTLVAYPIVSKLGISKNQTVAITVGGTILTDTAVLIILAVIVGNSEGNLNLDFWMKLGISLLIFSTIMFFIIPRIAKWFFKKLESEKHAHYIFVLSVVFFAAFLAEVAGVEPIIGAFVAGLSLNRLIPHSSALMNRIEFMGNSLFIPFFLISVGMLVDVRVIFSGSTALIVAGTLTIVALTGKWLAALFTQLIFGYTKTQRQLIFGLSSAHAAATLAIILVGYKAGILDENILNGTIILILITCIVATFATEKSAKKIVINSDDSKSDISFLSTMSSEHLLLPISDIKNMAKLLEFAILIKDPKSPNPISILSVVSNDIEAEMNIRKAKNKLEEFVSQASASETSVNIITTIDHNEGSGISRISKEIMANNIILAWSQSGGFLSKLIGEKIDNVLNNSDKTIFICHLQKPLISFKRIVIVAPPLAEYENGFESWLMKINKLASELSISLFFYVNISTQKAIKEALKKINRLDKPDFTLFEDWEDFLIISRNIREDDLLVLISSRKGSASYIGLLEHLPAKLEKHFKQNSKLLIYPQQFNQYGITENYSEITGESLNKGIEKIHKIGQGIGSIFKNK